MTIDDSLIMFGSTSGLFKFFGRATVMPCCKNGVTTMKMISSTSMMSTIGVTLISDCRPPLLPPACIDITESPFTTPQPVTAGAARAAPSGFTIGHSIRRVLGLQLLRAVLDEVVDQFRCRVVHLDDEAVDLAREVVEQPHSGYGHQQTKSGGKQRFRDTAGHSRDPSCLRVL